jgi:hypothetical protein
MSDTTTQRVPGATIVAKSNGLLRTTEADTAGCYELKDLTPGSYRVTARLLGFDNVTRDGVVLTRATVTHLDFTLRQSWRCECVRIVPPRTLAQEWAQADAVVHLRISDPEPGTNPRPWPNYRHGATILKAMKQHPAVGHAGTTIGVFEQQENGAPGPYDVGQELVAFLHWSPETNAFTGLGTDCCDNPSIVFVVRDGRIQSAPPAYVRYVGMRIDPFLEELRARAADQQRNLHYPNSHRDAFIGRPVVFLTGAPDVKDAAVLRHI